MTRRSYLISISKVFIIASMMLCTVSGAPAYNFSVVNDKGKRIYYNAVSDTEAEVTYETLFSPTYTYSGSLDIPELVPYQGSYLKVTGIYDRAFFGCRSLKEVNMPPTVKSIRQWAFGWCDSITTITIPAGVETIGADLFDGCYGLEEIRVDGGNGKLMSKDGAVYTSDGSTLVACLPTAEGEFVVPEGTLNIGDRALGGCTYVDSIRIASTVRSIGRDAFSFCNSLRGIHIPASVEEIDPMALADCFSLERIEVDGSNMNFSSYDGALYSNDFTRLIQVPGALPTLHFHPDIREIGKCAFLDNYGFTSIILPDSLTSVGDCSFAGCERIESVVIPEKVEHIGTLGFGLCRGLKNVYALNPRPDNIRMGEGVFAGIDRKKCTLYVPRGSREAYSGAEVWKDISNIVETDALLPQTIAWDFTHTRHISPESIRLGATASSGLPVTYSIGLAGDGIGILEGDILHILSPGLIHVTAWQVGNEAFLPAEPVTLIFGDPAGEEDIEVQPWIKVRGGKGEIVIEGAETEAITEVYDINGSMVYSGHARRIKVAGMKVYLVRIGGKAFKVAVS